MTEKKRIFVNILVTYVRSIVAMVCGIFTGRWLLMSLGKVDLGLYGVVGGMTYFMSFLSWPITSAVARFYAFSVGEASKNPEQGVEDCRKWFNSALFLLTVLPIGLLLIGYPIGEWAVWHWLTIPEERLNACSWVWRFACANCILTMVKVPFYSMFTAKQNIAELTLCTTLETAMNVVLLYYMVNHPGDWLAKYACWHFLSVCVISLLVCMIAMKLFPECRFCWRYLMNKERIQKLCSYSGWMLFGCVGALCKTQGIAILVNKLFNPEANTAMTLANSVSGHSNALSASITGAFAPAITNACGAQDYDKMKKYVLLSSKLGTYFILVFAIPLICELDYVLKLWLKNPPEYVYGLTICILITLILERTSAGYAIAISAFGKISYYQLVVGLVVIATLPVAYLLCYFFPIVYSVGYALIIMKFVGLLCTVYCAERNAKMNFREWLVKVFVPVLFVCLLGVCVGNLTHRFMMPSFGRLCTNFMIINVAILWIWTKALLGSFEKQQLRQLVGKKVPFLRRVLGLL